MSFHISIEEVKREVEKNKNDINYLFDYFCFIDDINKECENYGKEKLANIADNSLTIIKQAFHNLEHSNPIKDENLSFEPWDYRR